MTITVRTHDLEGARELVRSAPDGVSARMSRHGSKAAGDPYALVIVTLEFVRDFALSGGASLLAAWLYSKTKDVTCKMEYGADTIPNTQEAIQRLFDEELDIGKHD